MVSSKEKGEREEVLFPAGENLKKRLEKKRGGLQPATPSQSQKKGEEGEKKNVLYHLEKEKGSQNHRLETKRGKGNALCSLSLEGEKRGESLFYYFP